MTRLEIILSAIMTLSILFNIGLFAYARHAIVQLLTVSEELGDLQQMAQSLANHLDSVYKLEMFYGDQTIEALREHAIAFNENLETFEYIFSLTEEGNNPIDDTDKEAEAEEEA